MSRILIVEDEPRITSFLEKGLRADGFVTTAVADGDQAAAIARPEDFDLVILDLGLPGRDGFEVLAALRRRSQSLPVIILTARSGVEPTVEGFNRGADDYVTKPFRFEELLVRVRARLRTATPELTLLRVGGIVLDLRTRRATIGGRVVDLSAREFALAETFLRHPDQVLSREQLLDQVWGYDFDAGCRLHRRRHRGRGTPARPAAALPVWLHHPSPLRHQPPALAAPGHGRLPGVDRG